MSSDGRSGLRALGGLCCGAAVALGVWGAASAGERGSPSRLLVLNRHSDSLMVFELPSRRLSATVPVGDEPGDVAITPDGTKCYVSNAGDRTITVIDPEHWTVLRTLAPERLDAPHGLGITGDGRLLLATSEGSRRFYLFDTERDVMLRSLTSTEEGMHTIAMPGRGRDAYVANRMSGSITVLDAKKLAIETHVRVGPGPEGIAVTPDGRLLLVALQNDGAVAILKAGSARIRATLPAGRTPIRIAVTRDGSLALVSNRHSDDLTVIDLGALSVAGTIRVGRGPGGVAITPDGTHAYVANSDANTVSVVSVGEMRETGTFAAGDHPDGIAIMPESPPGDGPDGGKRRARQSGGGAP